MSENGTREEPSELQLLQNELGVELIDQDIFENEIQQKAEEKLQKQNLKIDLKRLERVQVKIKKLQTNIKDIQFSSKSTRGQQNKLDQLSQKLSEAIEEEADIIDYLKNNQKIAQNQKPQLSEAVNDTYFIQPYQTSNPYDQNIQYQVSDNANKSKHSTNKQNKRNYTQSFVDSEDSYQESMASDRDEELSEDHTSEKFPNKSKAKKTQIKEDFKYQDDMADNVFNERIKLWELDQPIHHQPDFQLNEYHLPKYISDNLFPYQKKAIHWMWELHNQRVGGILGDEMGLGKTVQIVSFLSGLHFSNMLIDPILIVSPATLLQQWVREFHKWYPPLRVVILKPKGGSANGENHQINDDNEKRYKFNKVFNSQLNKIMNFANVLVTTYDTVRIQQKVMATKRWSYVVLDEGHKIRNPDVEVTLSCKKLNTPHRLILSGTPIQNSLVDLWSLVDFIYPGRLGTLPLFQQHFCEPIKLASLASASQLQVRTSYECAQSLKDLIAPYLLRRLKSDVAIELPKKTEQVIFCQLTKLQYGVYEKFIMSDEVDRIVSGKQHVLSGIDTLRKICNHPDLLNNKYYNDTQSKFSVQKSGKLIVTQALLKSWYSKGLKSLIFFQTRQMLNIVENMVQDLNIPYLRMDGNNQIKNRMTLVDQFNSDPNISVFLLTTKVGGLGLNLTSAVRVIIYDPDWNPSTDLQARERAWRLGQTQEVTVYRLMTAGTIEERIYHRQIYKQYLTNKILKDPTQREFFHAFSLTELFAHPSMSGDKVEDLEFRNNRNISTDPATQLRHTAATNDDNIIEISSQVIDTERFVSQVKESTNTDTGENGVLNSLLDIAGIKKSLDSQTISQSNYLRDDAQRSVQKSLDTFSKFQSNNQYSSFAPTWTGKSGSIGKPETNLSGGKSQNFGNGNIKAKITGIMLGQNSMKNSITNSSSLLSRLQSHNQSALNTNPVNSPKKSNYQSTISLYLKKHGGKVAFSKVIEDFKDILTNDEQTKEFRKELKRQSVFVKHKNFNKSMCIANWCEQD